MRYPTHANRCDRNGTHRCTIEDLLHRKVSVTDISRRINSHRSTVYREIKRNFNKDEELPQLDGYYGMNAQRFKAERRARRRKLVRILALREAFDRGIEFSGWRKLKPGIETEAWFCDPQAPWQKGSVENLNKRARRYLPRDTPISTLSDRDMKANCERMNATPSKFLGWLTPAEAFAAELRKLE